MSLNQLILPLEYYELYNLSSTILRHCIYLYYCIQNKIQKQ